MRFGLVRFAWHRFLRIFPGFWVCLLVTAFGLAPLVALYEHGTLSGFFTHPAGPFDYVFRNITTGMNQYTISGLLADTPYGRLSGEGVWDGSLWSPLIYELSGYGLVALLVVTLVFKRARWVVPLLAAAAYGVILWDFLRGDGWIVEPGDHGQIGPIPLVGYLDVQLLIYLGFAFLLGATAQGTGTGYPSIRPWRWSPWSRWSPPCCSAPSSSSACPATATCCCGWAAPGRRR